MVDIDKAVIARLSRQGKHFEMLVDCDAALKVKEGKEVALDDLLAVQKVYSDSKKGLECKEGDIQAAFGTEEIKDLAVIIIQKGELQLTQEYRERLKEQKKRQIISMLHMNGVDPKTHAPHPVTRIETALNDAKFHVDIFEPVNLQVQEAMKKLKEVLPIRFERKELSVKIGPSYAGKAYATVKSFATILTEAWLENGYWSATVEIPGGMETDFYENINAICHGEAEIEVIKVK